MTKTKQLSVNIPFSGFYESSHMENINQAINSYFDREQNGDGENYEPEGFYFSFKHYKTIENEYCKVYTSAFSDYFENQTGIPLPLEYEELTSPKEYNFTTDRIFAKTPLKTLRTIYKQIDKEVLAETIKDRFTSRSGFISSYSNVIGDWLAKPLATWDHNELGTLLIAALAQHGGGAEEYDIMEPALCNGIILDIVYPYLAQWETENPYEADTGLKLKEFFDLPDDTFEAMSESEKDQLLATYQEATYHCTNTPDLFARSA